MRKTRIEKTAIKKMVDDIIEIGGTEEIMPTSSIKEVVSGGHTYEIEMNEPGNEESSSEILEDSASDKDISEDNIKLPEVVKNMTIIEGVKAIHATEPVPADFETYSIKDGNFHEKPREVVVVNLNQEHMDATNTAETEADLPGESEPAKKCVILCMCCNDEYYLKEFDDIMSTWGETIRSGGYTNLDIWGYTSSPKGLYEIDEKKHMLYVPELDSLNRTYDKTMKAIQMLDMLGIEYDWILRTNCSTTINCAMLNEMMIGKTLDENLIYVAKLFKYDAKIGPKPDYPGTQGNFMLFSRKYASLINPTALQIARDCTISEFRGCHPDLFYYDDMTMCTIWNTYMMMHHINPMDVYVILPTQYVSDIYAKKEALQLSSVAFFNKDISNLKPVRNYYYEMKDRYMDFYKNFYYMLNDSIEELAESMKERQTVMHIHHAPDRPVIKDVYLMNEYRKRFE